MLTKLRIMTLLVFSAMLVFALQTAGAQSNEAAGNLSQSAQTLKAAADALGMPRRTNRAGGGRLPLVDVVNRMEFWGSGITGDSSGAAMKTEYHVALSYDPPAIRVEMTRTNSNGGSATVPEHTIRTVRDRYAWDESKLGAGLEPGWGTATPMMSAVKTRLLQLWILPYGVVKAAIAAGDKTKISTENGATVVTFPLSGQLAGITVRATLDAKDFVTKVETQADNPTLVIEADYSDYSDHGEISSRVQSPGHVIQKQAGHTILDVRVKNWDSNGPYLVFPVPENVKKAAAGNPVKVAAQRR